MKSRSALILLAIALSFAAKAAVVQSGPGGILFVDGKPVFPIGFTQGPPPGAKTPEGSDAYAELATNGTVFHRTGPVPHNWGPEAEAALDRILERSAETRFYSAITMPDLQAPRDSAEETELRRVVNKYKSHPGLFFWKAEDEPEWGNVPVERVQRFYDIVHALDPNHAVWLTQAPRGTIESLKRYVSAYDVGALDIYPVSYPPGTHAHLPNKELSVVGDYTRWMRQVDKPDQPLIMALQICWSGVTKPGKTLRMPTFPQERYMSYQAIIDGARGLIFFGGDLAPCQSEHDQSLGWNWTFYRRVLKPVLDELNPGGPLYPALIAPDSRLPVRLEGASDLEFRVRETPDYLYLLAAKREGATVEGKFSALPKGIAAGEVLFEEPRKVTVTDGVFTDWFGPNEVHIYRFKKSS